MECLLIIITIVLALVLVFVLNKSWCFWSRSKVCLVGKTAIVTGGASGLGFQTALALASKGCRIIIADIANLDPAVEKIKKITHNPLITGKKIELQSLQSVRAFAKEILETETQLHILVCNAGIGEYRVKYVSDDGLERVMHINYFSHFLLTHLLLDLLKKSAPSRITFTSSMTAYISDLTIETLNPPAEYYDRWFIKMNGGVYTNSKLALAAAAKTFGEKLKGTGVTANCVHPAGVKTPIFWNAIKNDRNVLGIGFLLLVYIFGKNPEEGAQSLIHIAHSDEVKNISGQSFIEGRNLPRPFQLTDEFCKKLWEVSVKLTKLEPHEVKC